MLHLSADDTRTLAELLGGGTPVSEAVSAVQRLEGVAMDWIQVPEGSATAGTTIGDGGFRTRTGSSVVAIVRGEDTVAAPGPDTVLHTRDVVVAVGTADGLRQLRDLIEG